MRYRERRGVNDQRDVRYLRLLGRLEPDNRLLLRPGYLTSRPRQIDEQPDSDLVAVLVDDDRKELLRYGVPLLPYCADGKILNALAVRATIPFHPATRAIVFERNGLAIHEIDVAPGEPDVRLTWTPEGKEVEGAQDISWEAEHPSRAPLEFFLRYSHDGGETWQRASMRTRKKRQTLDFDALPGGRRCRVSVVATDGVNTAIAMSRQFAVAVKPCRALVLSPEDGSVFAELEPILFEGQGFYLEERRPELEALRWTSEPAGVEGTGPVLMSSDLAPGKYTVTLEAGEGRRVGRESVSIEVRGGRRRARS
jgi:hypothetical protein